MCSTHTQNTRAHTDAARLHICIYVYKRRVRLLVQASKPGSVFATSASQYYSAAAAQQPQQYGMPFVTRGAGLLPGGTASYAAMPQQVLAPGERARARARVCV